MAILGLFKTPSERYQQKIERAGKLMEEISSTRSYDLEKSILEGYNPDEFMTRKGFRTIDKMLDDESVYSILEFKKLFTLSTGYKFSIEDDGDEDILEFVKQSFGPKYSGLFGYDLYQMLTSYEYGFSISEKIYKKIDSLIYLERIKTIPPHSIEFHTDNMGKLDKIIQRQPEDQNKELPIEKMIIYTNGKRFDNPYGTTECKRCYKSWFLKDTTLKLWAIYLQRFASPFPVGKIGGDFSEGKVDALLKILDSIQQSVSMVIPKEAELELLKADRSGGEYDLAIERFNQMIARALLIPDLVGFGQTVKGGSYSLGEKHYEAFISICNFSRMQLQESINDNAIRQLVDINFGKQEVYPKFEFLPFEDEKLNKYADVFISAIDKGMPVANNDWNHLRNIIKYPELIEDEAKPVNQPTEEKPTTSPEAPSEDKPNPEPVAKQKNPTEEDIKDGNDKFEEDGTIVAFRAPSKYESRVDYIEEAHSINKQDTKTVNRLADKFKLIRDNLIATINKKGIISEGNLEAINKLQLRYLGDVRSILSFDLKEQYQESLKRSKKEIKQLAKTQNFELELEGGMLTNKEMIAKAEQLIDAQSFQAVGKIKDDLLNKVKQALISGLEQGLGAKQITKNINEIFNGVTEGTIAAKLSKNPTLLQTIVRTNSNNFFNLARKQTASKDDFIWGYSYSAILDSRTTEICMSLDGVKYHKSDPIWANITPPNHFNALLEGALITTKEGEKKIEDIKVGDLVLTHRNKYQVVYDTMNKFEDKEYYIIELDNGKELKVTGEHPILTKRGWLRMDKLDMADEVICISEIR